MSVEQEKCRDTGEDRDHVLLTRYQESTDKHHECGDLGGQSSFFVLGEINDVTRDDQSDRPQSEYPDDGPRELGHELATETREIAHERDDGKCPDASDDDTCAFSLDPDETTERETGEDVSEDMKRCDVHDMKK